MNPFLKSKKLAMLGVTITTLTLSGLFLSTKLSCNQEEIQVQQSTKQQAKEKILKLNNSIPLGQVVSLIQEPIEAQAYNEYYLIPQKDFYTFYNTTKSYYSDDEGEFWQSFQQTHKGIADCEDAAIANAVLLSDDGYKEQALALYTCPKIGNHMIYPFKKNGLYGTTGIMPKDYHEPQFKTLRDIAKHYGAVRYEIFEPKSDGAWDNYEGDVRDVSVSSLVGYLSFSDVDEDFGKHLEELN